MERRRHNNGTAADSRHTISLMKVEWALAADAGR